MARKRDPQAAAYAALRRRGKRELSKLQTEYEQMSTTQQQGYEGRRIQQQQDAIRKSIGDRQKKTGTYLGTNADKGKRLEAKEASQRLGSLIGEKGQRGRKAAQERRNRIFREQIRSEERGDASAMYGGVGSNYHYERIFYMATESIWRDADPQDREKKVLEALGVTDLETAYDMVLEQNAEALRRIHEKFGDDYEAWERGDSDTVMAYIQNALSLAIAR